MTTTEDVIVVGGGLAGLAAAATAAGTGRRVTVLEARSEPGGRARTAEQEGFLFDEGGHALYRDGEGLAVLRRFGIEPEGSVPPARGSCGLRDGRLGLLPAGPVSLVRTPLLGARAKLRMGRLLAGLQRIDPSPLASTTVGEWVDGAVADPDARALLHTLVRLTTYAHDPGHFSADAAVTQIQRGLGNSVLYLDGGWQRVVDALRQVAARAGATVETGTKVDRIAAAPAGVEVHVSGAVRRAGAVVVATGGPPALDSLLGATSAATARWAKDARVARVAALDVGLRTPWDDNPGIVLGVGEPVYLSLHAPVSRLAPDGSSLVSLFRYLSPDEVTDPDDDRRQLEGVLDVVRPGWRDDAVVTRFSRRLVACSALPTAATGGLAGRPGPDVPDAAGVFVAGDWVGPVGQLADAALASAVAAGEAAARVVGRRAALA